jgi:hypothetical protein
MDNIIILFVIKRLVLYYSNRSRSRAWIFSTMVISRICGDFNFVQLTRLKQEQKDSLPYWRAFFLLLLEKKHNGPVIPTSSLILHK